MKQIGVHMNGTDRTAVLCGSVSPILVLMKQIGVYMNGTDRTAVLCSSKIKI